MGPESEHNTNYSPRATNLGSSPDPPENVYLKSEPWQLTSPPAIDLPSPSLLTTALDQLSESETNIWGVRSAFYPFTFRNLSLVFRATILPSRYTATYSKFPASFAADTFLTTSAKDEAEIASLETDLDAIFYETSSTEFQRTMPLLPPPHPPKTPHSFKKSSITADGSERREDRRIILLTRAF